MKEKRRLEAESFYSQGGTLLFRVSLYDDDKLIEQQKLTTEAFANLLAGSVYNDNGLAVSTGVIPAGFYDGIKTASGAVGAIIRVPSQKHQFVLQKTDNKTEPYFIWMPNLVYLICGNKDGRVMTSKCYCYKEWRGDETELLQYPFGNVSSSGNICMGTVSTKRLKSYPDIAEYIEDSLLGVTNSDYLSKDSKGEGYVRLAVEKQTQQEFCESIKDSDAFPEHLLISSSSSNVEEKTVGDMRKSMYALYKCKMV